MNTVDVKGTSYQIHPPKRRIYVAEVARVFGSAPERACAAALGLAVRSLWGPTRREPRYVGDVVEYGEAVYEVLAEAGWSHYEIVTAGLAAWREWVPLVPTEEAVKEAEDFTDRPAEATSVSAATSS
jgi:hypothetical protein